MPRPRRTNPIVGEIPITPTMPTATHSPLKLPDVVSVELPDFQDFAESAVGFAPNAALPRVTDAEREEHALVYREQLNAAENLKDSIKVATAYVSAGVAATKLGRELVRYQIGVEDIRTAEVGLERAKTKTAIAKQELEADKLTLNYVTARLPHLESEYSHKLTEHKDRARRAQLKAEAFMHQTDNLLAQRDA